jgi:hypothetical protein
MLKVAFERLRFLYWRVVENSCDFFKGVSLVCDFRFFLHIVDSEGISMQKV